MWSDNDIDDTFRRLDPAEPDPTPFPLDAWLKLEAGLDQAVIDRAVRRRLWQFFAAEVAVVALVGLGWSLWPAGSPSPAVPQAQTVASNNLPIDKGTDTQRLQGSDNALTNTPVTPAAQSASGNIAQTAARPATASAASTATAAAIVSPARGTVGHGRPLPLAVAPTTDHRSPKITRSYAADGRFAARGKGTSVLVGPTVGHSENAVRPGFVGQQSVFHSQAAASAARANTSVQSSAYAESGRNAETTSRLDGSRMVAPSQGAASEAVVADAAPHGFVGAGTTPVVASRSINTSKSGVAYAAAGMEEATAATEANTAQLHMPVGSPAPLEAVATELTRPVGEPLPATLAPTELATNPLPAVVRQPRLFVGIVAAPDVSTVKFADVRAPRLNVGLTLEYQLGQRWRIATGVQRSPKDYYARREDYDWTNYPRAYTRDFNWVDGSCTIIDVPLNLRYDALVGPRYRLFGTAGLSSFFMQHERYTYDYYDNASNAPVVWERSYANVNQHWFSVLNLSAGYEYDLSNHWRLQAEPYVKVPLAGVGAGKVKLLSAGLYFGVKYGF